MNYINFNFNLSVKYCKFDLFKKFYIFFIFYKKNKILP